MSVQGKTNNPKGRPKGSVNNDTSYIRFRFEQLLNGYDIEDMRKDLMSCEPKERLRIVCDLAEYIIPKLQRTEFKGNVEITSTQIFEIGGKEITF
jgi:hypothetical protein